MLPIRRTPHATRPNQRPITHWQRGRAYVLNCKATLCGVERPTFNKNLLMSDITDINDLRLSRTNKASDRQKVRIGKFDAAVRFRAQNLG